MRVEFHDEDGLCMLSAGTAATGRTFEDALAWYCFTQRVTPLEQHAKRLREGIDRGIKAGLIVRDSTGRIHSVAMIADQLAELLNTEANEFDACSKLDDYLQSRSWPVSGEEIQ